MDLRRVSRDEVREIVLHDVSRDNMLKWVKDHGWKATQISQDPIRKDWRVVAQKIVHVVVYEKPKRDSDSNVNEGKEV